MKKNIIFFKTMKDIEDITRTHKDMSSYSKGPSFVTEFIKLLLSIFIDVDDRNLNIDSVNKINEIFRDIKDTWKINSKISLSKDIGIASTKSNFTISMEYKDKDDKNLFSFLIEFIEKLFSIDFIKSWKYQGSIIEDEFMYSDYTYYFDNTFNNTKSAIPYDGDLYVNLLVENARQRAKFIALQFVFLLMDIISDFDHDLFKWIDDEIEIDDYTIDSYCKYNRFIILSSWIDNGIKNDSGSDFNIVINKTKNNDDVKIDIHFCLEELEMYDSGVKYFDYFDTYNPNSSVVYLDKEMKQEWDSRLRYEEAIK